MRKYTQHSQLKVITVKVLIPIDVMHMPPDFVEDLASIKPLDQEEVSLLFVKNITPAYENVINSMGDFADDWGHQIEKKAKEKLEPVEKALKSKGAKVNVKFASGNPAQSIADLAKSLNVDFTCVLPLKHGKVESFFVGSTSRKVAKLSPGNTIVLRPGPKSLKHIVFAFDGSKDSIAALKQITTKLDLKKRKIKTTVLHVVTVPHVMAIVPEVNYTLEKNLLMHGEVVIAEALEELKSLGIEDVKTELMTGEPAEKIIDYAKKTDAEMIVLGAKGHSPVEHLILGSVTDRVTTHAPMSVAICKSGK